MTADTVEIHFGFLRHAVGEGACRVLDDDQAVETWTRTLRANRVDIYELAAAINMASERGAPSYNGVSLAWFMGLIRERRALKAAEHKPLPADLDVMKEAKTSPEYRTWVSCLKAILARQSVAEKDSPARVAALKELQHELFDPGSYCARKGWKPKRKGFGVDIARIEKKLADEEAGRRRDEAFVAEFQPAQPAALVPAVVSDDPLF